MNILLLEDDIALNRAITKVLELDHHSVDTFFNGREVMNALDQRYQLYILDINVPYLSGMEILDIILIQNKQTQVIMISSNTDMQSMQTAYDLGCVDYIKKPFHIAELRAKISRLKLSQKSLLSSIAFKSDDEILTKKERKLLNLLLNNLTFVVDYKRIEEHVYENSTMSMDALRTLVRRLRAKLLDDIIVNVIDEGYTISHLPNISKQNQRGNAENRMESLERENSLLKAEREVLLKKSFTDPLTSLYNRNKIQEIFLYAQQQFIDHGAQLSVILIDLDNFKQINDSHGHNTGDKYLQELAGTLSDSLHTEDIIGRWGGEEFIILLQKTSLEQTKEIALRLREIIKNIHCPKLGTRTASFGLSTLMSNDTLSTFVGRADKALLQAKVNGKDRVEVNVGVFRE